MNDETDLVFDKLIELLKKNNAKYRLVFHELAGKSKEVSEIRGSKLEQGAKAMVLKAKDKYILAVLGAHLKLDLKKIKHILNQKVSFASPEEVEEITGCAIGSVPPFSFDERLVLLVDESITKVTEIAFNAARLDASIFLDCRDYLDITKARIVDISKKEA
jgi:Ala-tRNA(Pro) deacylase